MAKSSGLKNAPSAQPNKPSGGGRANNPPRVGKTPPPVKGGSKK